MKPFLIAAVLGMIAIPAEACSVLSLDATRQASDVIVRGTGTFDLATRSGVIRTKRVEKGRRQAQYRIRWKAESPEGVECGEWQPLRETERGRYFLARNDDGTFSIILHDQRPGIDR